MILRTCGATVRLCHVSIGSPNIASFWQCRMVSGRHRPLSILWRVTTLKSCNQAKFDYWVATMLQRSANLISCTFSPAVRSDGLSHVVVRHVVTERLKTLWSFTTIDWSSEAGTCAPLAWIMVHPWSQSSWMLWDLNQVFKLDGWSEYIADIVRTCPVDLFDGYILMNRQMLLLNLHTVPSAVFRRLDLDWA